MSTPALNSDAVQASSVPDAAPTTPPSTEPQPKVKPQKVIEPFITHGIRGAHNFIEGELDYNLRLRLQQYLALQDPSLPYPGDPLPHEPPPPPPRQLPAARDGRKRRDWRQNATAVSEQCWKPLSIFVAWDSRFLGLAAASSA
ncbi:hypothetical protein R3P38DRAFT_2777882 [Favolaschia claudopus]|uniref:Uncharacterized protein n=1 Tax=Favolaschia claudopus TaxID=2862362 RepID=A0AAW0BK31_9AGAR